MFKAITNILRSTASKVYKQTPAPAEDPYEGLYDEPQGIQVVEEEVDPGDLPVFRAVGSTFWYALPQLWTDFDGFGLYQMDDLDQKTILESVEDVEGAVRLASMSEGICFGAFYQGRFVRFVQ